MTLSSPDDFLIARARKGEAKALEHLLRVVHPQVIGACRHILGTASYVDDAVQQTLIAIAKGLHSFNGQSAFTTWTYRIAYNACIDERRKFQRHADHEQHVPHASDATSTGDSSTSLIEQLRDPNDFAELFASGQSLNTVLRSALECVPEDFRVAVVFRDVACMEYAEIAELLNIPIGTVRSRIARGRAQLADLLRNNPAFRELLPGVASSKELS